MKTALLAACCLSAVAGPALADELRVRDFIGRIELVTGGYDSVDVRVIEGPAMGAPDVRRDGERVEVTGEWDSRTRNRGWSRRDGLNCRGQGGDLEIRFGGDGYRPISDYPTLRITAPRDVSVRLEDSILVGAIGAIGEGQISHSGCGDLSVESVQGDLRATIAGSGTMTIGDVGGSLAGTIAGSGDLRTEDIAGDANASVAGSGNVELGAVAGGMNMNIAGSGRIVADAANGDVNASIAGSGDMVVAGGTAREVEVNIMGSGNFNFAGAARMARINVMGSGDVDIAQADDADVRAAGGDVRVNGVRIR